MKKRAAWLVKLDTGEEIIVLNSEWFTIEPWYKALSWTRKRIFILS